MKLVITGATGFVGIPLVAALAADGHKCVALSRNATTARRRVPGLTAAHDWDLLSEPAPAKALDGAHGVIHLAGASVAGLWTRERRRAIRETRTTGTRNLVRGMSAAASPPRVLISASAIGYYGDRGDEELTEDVTPGDDFLAGVCEDWEAEARAALDLGCRVVMPRIGLVLHPEGGALAGMLRPFQLGLGGKLGSGRQWWSWIHRDDLVSLILFSLRTEVEGVLNATAPHPVRQSGFASTLGSVISRPTILPAPAFALRLLLGGFSAELLSSKRVLPSRTQAAGFQFDHPELEPALRGWLGS